MERKEIDVSELAAILEVKIEFTWHSEIAQKDCKCGLRIFKIGFDKAVIIVSELQDNPGRSITEEAVTLINLVCYKFGLSPFKTMWIEHYPEGYLKEEDTYDEIRLSPFRIDSKRIKKQNLEALLGLKI